MLNIQHDYALLMGADASEGDWADLCPPDVMHHLQRCNNSFLSSYQRAQSSYLFRPLRAIGKLVRRHFLLTTEQDAVAACEVSHRSW